MTVDIGIQWLRWNQTLSESEVGRVGWTSAFCYGILIPAFLGFLFAKQNVMMRKAKTVMMHISHSDGQVVVRLQGPETEQSFKERACSLSLIGM